MNLFADIDPEFAVNPTQKGFIMSDGGSRGNPGIAGSGAVLYDMNKKEIGRDGIFCGVQTNNFAEYEGMICGLNLALKNNVTDLEVYMDSKLIVEQMSGRWKVKNANIKPLFERGKNIAKQFEKISYHHVRREKNTVADSIANEVMDRGGYVA